MSVTTKRTADLGSQRLAKLDPYGPLMWDSLGVLSGALPILTQWFNSSIPAPAVAKVSTGLEISGNTPAYVMNLGEADHSFAAMSSNGGGFYLFPRFVDINNWIGWNPSFSGATGRWRQRVSGTMTTLDESTAVGATGASSYGVSVVGNLFTLYADGAVVTTRTNTNHAGTTSVAFGHINSSGSVVITRYRPGAVSL